MSIDISAATLSGINIDSGVSSSDYITAYRTPVISGTVTAADDSTDNDVLGIWLSGDSFGAGTLVGSITISAPGTTDWSDDLDRLDGGSYTITVTAGTAGIDTNVLAQHSLTVQ